MTLPIGSDNIRLNLERNRQDLATSTSRLASGLRIQTAADDPSGLAISESLRARISGLQQSVENVQTGGNLLRVADGAAATIQQILQRIRSLIVESNSDINSNAQLTAIQAEIGEGLLEINRIAQNVNFNGLKLFDGSHDTTVATPNTGGNANVTAVLEKAGIAPNGDVATPIVANSQQSSPYLVDPNITEVAGQVVTGLFIFNVSQYDPTTSTVTLGLNMYSQDTSFGAAPQSLQSQAGIGTNTGPNQGSGGALNLQVPSGQSITINLANISPQDAGPVSEAIEIFAPKQSGGGTAIGINDGGQEGTTVSISLPTLNTNALQISNISVLRPLDVDPFNNVVGQDSSNQYAAMDAQIRVDAALDSISTLRSTLGAQMVATQEDANNDNTAIVNFQATESSIRDLNIGTATTQFTREQILNALGTSVLAQSNVSARQLTALLIGALVA